jgi:hypothetical protein
MNLLAPVPPFALLPLRYSVANPAFACRTRSANTAFSSSASARSGLSSSRSAEAFGIGHSLVMPLVITLQRELAVGLLIVFRVAVVAKEFVHVREVLAERALLGHPAGDREGDRTKANHCGHGNPFHGSPPGVATLPHVRVQQCG